MHSLRGRLILAFVLATMVPLAATMWVTTSLIERSLGYASTAELDRLSRTFESTTRQFYERERETLRRDAASGRAERTLYAPATRTQWPETIRDFWNSRETERFDLSGDGGNRLEYMKRTESGVEMYARELSTIHMRDLSTEYARARDVVDAMGTRDLRRGFTLTLLLLIAAVWLASLAPLIFIAHRVSRPIQQLTAGLTDFAAGDWNRRIQTTREDEVGRAVNAFNHMADQLTRNRDRLVYLTQIASWQSLAKKTAHELKNSLTPIRLTVEEMLARQPTADRKFLEEAGQIVISEIDTLERRVRAFSEFSSEPPVTIEDVDVNALVTERVSLLKPAHAGTAYRVELASPAPVARAGTDLVKGILTNLLENAADAAGPHGTVLTHTRAEGDHVVLEVHDSGPGVSAEAARTLFEPTITFKKHGMGLGLSIARKNALLSGGDVALVPGELGGAGFRVTLPAAAGTIPGASGAGEPTERRGAKGL